MYKYLCLNVLVALLLLPSSALAHRQSQPNPCSQAGTVAISTDGPPPTVKLTICTGLPQHIKRYLSVQNYWFATTDALDVRINDRGPFVILRRCRTNGARQLVLDLSYGAASNPR